MHAAAAAFLAEIGGLAAEYGGSGISRARESFALDPQECVGEGDRFLGWSQNLRRQIVPIGSLDQGRFFLGVMPEPVDESLVERWRLSLVSCDARGHEVAQARPWPAGEARHAGGKITRCPVKKW